MTHSHPHSSILEPTLQSMTRALERALFAEEFSQKPGLFQSLDARVKLVSVLVLLISVSLSHSLWVIGSIYGAVLVLAFFSAIPPGLLITRVWLALPFFTIPIAVPALFLTPGPTLLELPGSLVITQTGMTTALFLLLRVSTSLSLTLLLILTTPWNMVLSALTVLRVPDVFILMLGMTYRYIYLLLRLANDMFLSRKSRVVGRLSASDDRQMLAAAAGTLLDKSLGLSSEVYLAMRSRGFRGTIISLNPFAMRGRDWIWLIALGMIATVGIVLGR